MVEKSELFSCFFFAPLNIFNCYIAKLTLHTLNMFQLIVKCFHCNPPPPAKKGENFIGTLNVYLPRGVGA